LFYRARCPSPFTDYKQSVVFFSFLFLISHTLDGALSTPQ
jgi:hypothetical protein